MATTAIQFIEGIDEKAIPQITLTKTTIIKLAKLFLDSTIHSHCLQKI